MVMNELERKFLNALCEHYTIDLRQEKQDATEGGCTCDFELFKAQKRIDIYVVDFYIKDFNGDEYVIEIDGQESHKTKEQRFHDYNRERYLQKKGIHVVRFMGTEAYLDADGCIDEFEKIRDYMINKDVCNREGWWHVEDALTEINAVIAGKRRLDLTLIRGMLLSGFKWRDNVE